MPRCDCHASALRTHNDLRASLGHLLAVLREQQVIVALPGPSGPIAEELHRYNVYMRDAGGLSVGTRKNRLAIVAKLLQCKFAGAAIAIGELQPEDVRGFIATELTRVNSVSHATALAAALRAYFRYRATCGDALHALLGVISSPARWSLASLPRALSAEQVQVLLTSCAEAGSAPLRLLAMVHLALDLGLRVGDIAQVSLHDCPDAMAASPRQPPAPLRPKKNTGGIQSGDRENRFPSGVDQVAVVPHRTARNTSQQHI